MSLGRRAWGVSRSRRATLRFAFRDARAQSAWSLPGADRGLGFNDVEPKVEPVETREKRGQIR